MLWKIVPSHDALALTPSAPVDDAILLKDGAHPSFMGAGAPNGAWLFIGRRLSPHDASPPADAPTRTRSRRNASLQPILLDSMAVHLCPSRPCQTAPPTAYNVFELNAVSLNPFPWTQKISTLIHPHKKGSRMYHLAQVNIARMIAPLTDPLMAGFVAQLAPVNALADSSPGFIWRLQTDAGDATSLSPYTDPLILINMSVWTSLNTLSSYVYASENLHREVMKQRRRWFQRFDGPYTTLWWVPQGHIPGVEEAKERLEHLRLHGPSPYSFTIKMPFPSPDPNYEPLLQQPEECLP